MENKSLAVVEEKPQEVIEAAKLAAQQLTNIVTTRENKLVVGGKQYLFFEDWQMLGKFYGVTARVLSSEEMFKHQKPLVEIPLPQAPVVIGYLAKAAAVHQGYEVSTAEAECTIKEPNWASKPMFQLRSMAQTRACSKALRNCLGWVAVLAGYEAASAEEVQVEPPAGKRLLLEMVDVAKAKNYTKDDILAYGEVNTLSELSTEQVARIKAMMQSGEPLIPGEPSW